MRQLERNPSKNRLNENSGECSCLLS